MSDATLFAILWICGLVTGAGLVGDVVMLNGSGPATRRACDAEVHRLLTTHDPLELQRAGLLVRQLRCDVARRWVPAAAGMAS